MFEFAKAQQPKDRKLEDITSDKAAIFIQAELIKRTTMNGVEWIEKRSPEFRKLFDSNKEQFMKMYRENPEALYTLLEEALELQN